MKQDEIMKTQPLSTKSKAWLFKAFGEEQSYGGHDGYGDIIDKVYKYDSFVPNNKRVSKGDYALIRDQDVLLGLARISKIETIAGTKRRRRCPKCGTSSLNERTVKRPSFKCDKCKHEFDNPITSQDACDLYDAFLEGFVDLNGVFNRLELRKYCLRLNEQLAIQEIDFTRFIKDLLLKVSSTKRRQVEDVLEFSNNTHATTNVLFEESYVPSGEDMRHKIMKQISERRGQKEFRNSLIQVHEGKCAVTGCRTIELLEAAHISPYRGEADHHITNGLLLRADIHTLFDLGLLAIHPETLIVNLSFKINDPEYTKYHGQRIDHGHIKISQSALKIRWEIFVSNK